MHRNLQQKVPYRLKVDLLLNYFVFADGNYLLNAAVLIS